MTLEASLKSSAEKADSSTAGSTTSSTNGSNVPVQKTPVSLLRELYVRHGVTPKYDLVQIEGAVHEPTFKYRVAISDEFVATGSGQSKKKAKHMAAKAVLEKIKAAQEKNKDGKIPVVDGAMMESLSLEDSSSPNNKDASSSGKKKGLGAANVQLTDLDVDISSPYDDGIEGNPVGDLQELCMNRRMQPPLYEVSHEEGQPHERSFVMVCSVGSQRESGKGKSKKVAKKCAAAKMLNALKQVPVENDEVKYQVIDEGDLAHGIAVKSKGGVGGRMWTGLLRPKEGSTLAKLQELTADDIYTMEEPDRLLRMIGEEQHFRVEDIEIEELSTTGLHHFLVQMATTPVAVCYGAGESRDKAKRAAVVASLQYLKMLIMSEKERKAGLGGMGMPPPLM